MGCPVHIWVPMAAALAPAATMARHKLRILIPSKQPVENPADRVDDMTRWTPVAAPSTTDASSD